MNSGWRSFFGATPTLGDVVPPEIATALGSDGRIGHPVELVSATGQARWLRPALDEVGGGKVVMLFDATEEVATIEAAEEARRVRDLLLNDATIGTWLYDPDLDVYDFSPELLHLTPLSQRSAAGKRLGRIPRAVMDDLYHPDDLLLSRPIRERIVTEGGKGSLELRLRNRAGTGWDHLRVSMRSGRRRPSGRHEMYGVSQVITELAHARDEARRSAERVQALASIDVLTGLANRRTFEDRMRAAASAAARGVTASAVLYIDLDRFKEVNDTLGHEAGDELLRQVAGRLSALVRTEDTVARLGGDEFAVVLHGADPAASASFAQRAVDTLKGAVHLGAGEVELSCSVGVALVGHGGQNWDDALRQADLALYRAKSLGRGCFCIYEAEMDAALKARKALEVDLRLAIDRNEITTVYQPMVAADGRIVAMEALSRWTHQVRGPIPPAVFIPLAERTDLISPLGATTFRRVCLDTARWSTLPVAVNVSAQQLRRPGFVDRVCAILAETGAEASRFEFELTESSVLDDDLRTQEVLRALRELGCRLSLDDFGTGYSSLSYLQKYPIDRIKLDRSFIVRLKEGTQARAIVSTVVQLANALALELIAEGVETVEQFDVLTDIGVHIFQGFLFSPPVALGPAEGLLRQEIIFPPRSLATATIPAR